MLMHQVGIEGGDMVLVKLLFQVKNCLLGKLK